jgi:RND superfamily putative drug exporter
MIGVGMITAITVDAALVRTLLVPATIRLLGHRNWWAPRPLRAAYHRYGIHEPATPAPHRPGTAAQADITRLTGIDVAPSLSGAHHREGGPGAP